MKFDDLCFKLPGSLAKIRKDNKLNVTFSDKDDAKIYELVGSVADFVDLCDGKKNVREISDILKLTTETEEEKENFSEMLSFLQAEGIIEKCN